MSKFSMSTTDAAIAAISLDRAGAAPLHVQLTSQLRDMILSGRIAPGGRLPGSRAFAGDLGVSRITVTTSMDQLVAEGFAEGRHGKGLFVAPHLPDTSLKITGYDEPFEIRPIEKGRPAPLPFQPAAHDGRLFPHQEWAKLLEQAWRNPDIRTASGIDPSGHPALREAIAHHLHEWRGLRCQPTQVFVTAGGGDATQLLIRALGLAGHEVILEDPGYPLFASELSQQGVGVVPVAVDEDGLDPAAMPAARLAITTPSRHYPTGVTMPLARRLDLLAWSDRHHALILEDDFDSEYRYRGTPLPTLIGLADNERVLYMGSFSKVFTPQLRLGYLVVPEPLVAAFEQVLRERGPLASAVAQPALAQFMVSGRFATHIRRMRRVYSVRQQALVESVSRHLSGLLEVRAEAGGMHLTAKLSAALSARMSDTEVSQRATEAGLVLPALSSYSAASAGHQGLLMGYSGFDETELDSACATLAGLLQV
ncbi:MAG: PLP-dependent aminotransferase family protein, partial [Pseudomonadota bacterium]